MSQVCIEPGCPMLRPCRKHERTSSRHGHGLSRQARGYDAAYEAKRARLLGRPCAMRLPGCTGTATTAQHNDDGTLSPACGHCNFADGQRRMVEARGGGVKTAPARTRRTASYRDYIPYNRMNPDG